MALFLKRKIGCGKSFDNDFFRFYFKRLFCLGSELEFSCNVYTASDVEMCDFVKISEVFFFKNHLDIFEKRAVVKFDKAENVGRTHTSYPACNADFLISVFFCFSENFLDFNTFHILPPLIVKPKFFVQTSVTYRLGDVIGFYVFACVKVGDGARNLYYTRMCPCR